MTKHTPGPWQVHPDYPLCVGRYHNHALIGARYGHDSTYGEIASHYSKAPIAGEYPSLISYEEAKANARLIAAAPELLAACETLLATFHDHPDRDEVSLQTARNAVAKAKGGA